MNWAVLFRASRERRSVAAERRTKRHFGREDPFADVRLAEIVRGWLKQRRIKSHTKRRQDVKQREVWMDLSGRVEIRQRGLQREARRDRRGIVMRRIGRRIAVITGFCNGERTA